jgi:hypothetical protein
MKQFQTFILEAATTAQKQKILDFYQELDEQGVDIKDMIKIMNRTFSFRVTLDDIKYAQETNKRLYKKWSSGNR